MVDKPQAALDSGKELRLIRSIFCILFTATVASLGASACTGASDPSMACEVSCAPTVETGSNETLTDEGASDATAPGMVFTSDFDTASVFLDLFPDDMSGWTNVQLVDPDGGQKATLDDGGAVAGANRIDLQQTLAHSDCCAVRFVAAPSGASVSKAALQKEGLAFGSGDDLWISAWLWIEGTQPLQGLFILDIETTGMQGSPGRRLMMSGGDNELKVESKGNASGPEYRQSPGATTPFPKNTWVQLVVHLHLSADQDGVTEIWQNGTKAIEATGQNLTSEDTVYDRLQFGITANSATTTTTVYLDDVMVSTQPLEPIGG